METAVDGPDQGGLDGVPHEAVDSEPISMSKETPVASASNAQTMVSPDASLGQQQGPTWLGSLVPPPPPTSTLVGNEAVFTQSEARPISSDSQQGLEWLGGLTQALAATKQEGDAPTNGLWSATNAFRSAKKLHEAVALTAEQNMREAAKTVAAEVAARTREYEEKVRQAAANVQETATEQANQAANRAQKVAAKTQEVHEKVKQAAMTAQEQAAQAAATVQMVATKTQEAHEHFKQAAANVQETAVEQAAVAVATVQEVHDTVKQHHSRVMEGTMQVATTAQEVGQAVSSAAVLGGQNVREGAQQAVDFAQLAHQDLSCAAQEGGSKAVLQKSIGYTAKAAVTSYAAFQGAKSMAIEKSVEAGLMAAQAISENLEDETKQRLSDQANQVLDYAHIGAQQAASKGEELLSIGYTQYNTASQTVNEVVEEAYRSLPEERRQALEASRSKMNEAKEHAKAVALELSKPVRQRIIASIGDVLKRSAVEDPDMWGWVRRLVVLALDDFWADVELEVEHALELNLMRDLSQAEPQPPPAQGLADIFRNVFMRCRSFVLYHFLPCDKSIFGMFKDPVYLIFLAITCFPFYSFRVFFFAMLLGLLVIAPDGVDEYQLVSFILSSKGMQFFTGVVLNAYGSAQYYCAIHFCNLSQECIDRHTPGQGEPAFFAIVDYFCSVLLVWVAFGLLPYSSKHGLLAQMRQQSSNVYVQALESKEKDLEQRGEGAKKRGGRLFRILWWDAMWFSVCSCVLLVLEICTGYPPGSPGFLANLFWCRVAYSTVSAPFFVFCLPGVRQLLTHAEPTGFSRSGYAEPLLIGRRRRVRESTAPASASATQPLLEP